MTEKLRTLIVEDSPDDATLVVLELRKQGFEVTHTRVETADGMRAALTKEPWDIILCDYNIPNFGAMKALALVKELNVDTPFIVVSGVVGEDTAVNTMRAGAHDFIVKGQYSRLVPAIKREIEEHVNRKEQEQKIKKQTEEAEKQKQLAFTMMMQNPQPLILVNTDYHVKIANEAFLTLSGLSEKNLQSMSIRDFRVLEKTGHNIREALEAKKGVTGDVVVEFPTGIHYLEQHTIPLLDKDGAIVALMAVYNDNTEKRQLDAAKKEFTDYQSSYFKSLSDDLTLMAEGNLDLKLVLPPPNENTRIAYDQFVTVNTNIERVRDSLKLLITDANMLSQAAVDGKLATRADVSRHQGDFRRIVEGVNNTLDEVIGPLNVAANYVDHISKGTIPAKITDNYNGDFNDIKNNLNALIEVLNNRGRDVNTLINSAVEGKLDYRADLSGYTGVHKDAIAGVNRLLDKVVGPLKVAADYVDRISKGDIPAKITDTYNGDFNLIKNNLNTCIDAVNLLVKDANMLSQAAVDGKLATRADASKHQGDFRRIVEGVNQTLDSVIEPVNEAMRISNEYAKQNFSARVDENLQVRGDFIRFKESLNNVGIQVSRAMVKVNEQVTELAAGAEEASASVEEVAAGANQIAKNAGAVSLNADKSGEGIRQVLKAMEDLSTTVQEVATKADKVAQIAKKSEELSQNGSELAAKADQGMNEITKSSTEVNKIILDIKSQMDKIGDIVVLIANLANQTNLLALNAAIEAARAGDAGRGFAVVAAEVKALAQESRGSAEKIRQMIGELQKQTQRAVECVEKANNGVHDGSTALTQTLEVFNKIVVSIEEINKNINDVAASAEEQAASVEEVTASVSAVNTLIDDTAKEATDAAAASEESSAAIDQIAKVVQNVTTIVDSVTHEISAFKVDGESVTVTAARNYSPQTASAR
jgi:methyl-accepting chemotaxis protein